MKTKSFQRTFKIYSLDLHPLKHSKISYASPSTSFLHKTLHSILYTPVWKSKSKFRCWKLYKINNIFLSFSFWINFITFTTFLPAFVEVNCCSLCLEAEYYLKSLWENFSGSFLLNKPIILIKKTIYFKKAMKRKEENNILLIESFIKQKYLFSYVRLSILVILTKLWGIYFFSMIDSSDNSSHAAPLLETIQQKLSLHLAEWSMFWGNKTSYHRFSNFEGVDCY